MTHEEQNNLKWALIYTNRHIDELAYQLEKLERRLCEVCSDKYSTELEGVQMLRQRIKEDEEYTINKYK